ncbi:unnamed protein product [Staurois parvus]|uniref:Uncharacterized protein n=1 Tax=Staurois parvus TaxID=386267 RepID=A0ABN9CC87_9NEOB|nr:unnamed protein product [Staurois parvus]
MTWRLHIHSTGDDQRTAGGDTVQEVTRDCGHSTGDDQRLQVHSTGGDQRLRTVQEMTRDCGQYR